MHIIGHKKSKMAGRGKKFCLYSPDTEIGSTYITLRISKARARKFSCNPDSKRSSFYTVAPSYLSTSSSRFLSSMSK